MAFCKYFCAYCFWNTMFCSSNFDFFYILHSWRKNAKQLGWTMYFLLLIISVQFTATPDRIATDLYCTISFIQTFEAQLCNCFGLKTICFAQYCLFTKSNNTAKHYQWHGMGSGEITEGLKNCNKNLNNQCKNYWNNHCEGGFFWKWWPFALSPLQY